MTDQVMYTTRWNSLNRQPIAGHEWISENTARELAAARDDLVVVDAVVKDTSGAPRPRWVIGFGGGPPRVRFYDKHTTCWRLVDYDLIDGRYWRWIVNDYLYPDDQQQWQQSQAILKVEAAVRPDGTGDITVTDKQAGKKSVSQFKDIITDSYWLDVPEFGDWAPLTNPGRSATDIAAQI